MKTVSLSRNISKKISKKILPAVVMSLFSLLFTSCTTKEFYSSDLKVVKEGAEEAYEKQNYSKAGELYFRLWCSNPNEKDDALLKSVNAYLKAKKYQEVLDLVEDLIIMKGENYNNYEPLLIKTLAYYNQVKSSETDINHAYNALANLSLYKQFAKIDESEKDSKLKADPAKSDQLIDGKELQEMELYLKNIITYHKLKSAYQAYSHIPPSLISAMEQAKGIMEEHPDSEVAKSAKEIWLASARMLNLREPALKTEKNKSSIAKQNKSSIAKQSQSSNTNNKSISNMLKNSNNILSDNMKSDKTAQLKNS